MPAYLLWLIPVLLSLGIANRSGSSRLATERLEGLTLCEEPVYILQLESFRLGEKQVDEGHPETI